MAIEPKKKSFILPIDVYPTTLEGTFFALMDTPVIGPRMRLGRLEGNEVVLRGGGRVEPDYVDPGMQKGQGVWVVGAGRDRIK